MSGRVGSITTDIIAEGLVFNMDAANRASTIPSTTTTKTFNTVDTSISGAFSADAEYDSSTLLSPTFALDGTDDFIDVTKSSIFAFGTGGFTISMWIRGTNFNTTPYLVDFRENQSESTIAFYVNINSRLEVYINGSTIIGGSGTTLSQDTIYNVVCTRNGSTLSTHINGASADQSVSNSTNFNLTRSPLIGRRFNSTSQYWNGNLGPIQMYDRGLSANEVLHNYNALKGRFGL
jgi:hypothetical protein